MRKFLGVLLLLLGLTFVFSGIYHIFKSRNDVTAYALESVDMPEETYILYVSEDDLTFSAVSPFGWSDSFFTILPSFVVYSLSGNFVLGASRVSDIGNELQLIENFTLSQTFETTIDIEGFFDDYSSTAEVFISSSFGPADNWADYVRFSVKNRTQTIEININNLNRLYTIVIETSDGQFAPLDDNVGDYYYLINYFEQNSLFQEGFQEGLAQGTAEGYSQGEIDGYNTGYAYGVQVGSNGDLFGSSIIPSVNSLFEIEILPNVSFATIFSVGFGVLLLGLCIKIFLGG